jgi:hypothetical protein
VSEAADLGRLTVPVAPEMPRQNPQQDLQQTAQQKPLGPAPGSAHDTAIDPRVTALRERDAPRLDPIGLRYIEALARRTAGHGGEVRRLLDTKLEHAVASCVARLDQLERERAAAAAAAAAGATPDLPPPGHSPLGELVAMLDRHAVAGPVGGRVELKAMSQSRSTWARLSVGRQMARSLAKVPENPGPLNSHLLMLRALRTMQDISPGYLEHFMAYADALLWLDQASFGGLPAAGNVVRRETERKRRTGRGKSA